MYNKPGNRAFPKPSYLVPLTFALVDFTLIEQYVQAMQRLTKFMSPIMVLLRPVLSLIWFSYGFGDASA